jgi:hypothetical protein
MKIDDIILKLNQSKEKYGNLDVKCCVPEVCWSSGALVSTYIGDITKIEFYIDHIIIKGEQIEI